MSVLERQLGVVDALQYTLHYAQLPGVECLTDHVGVDAPADEDETHEPVDVVIHSSGGVLLHTVQETTQQLFVQSDPLSMHQLPPLVPKCHQELQDSVDAQGRVQTGYLHVLAHRGDQLRTPHDLLIGMGHIAGH